MIYCSQKEQIIIFVILIFCSLVKYPYAGQNIARRGNTRGYEKTKSSILKMISAWFIEYKDADMSYIKSYHNHKQG